MPPYHDPTSAGRTVWQGQVFINDSSFLGVYQGMRGSCSKWNWVVKNGMLVAVEILDVIDSHLSVGALFDSTLTGTRT